MYLVINSGSSSLKFKLFDAGLQQLASGIVERIGLKASFLDFTLDGVKGRRDFPRGVADHDRALKEVFGAMSAGGFDPRRIRAVGHRVVHGGERFSKPTLVTPTALKWIKYYTRLAPLHNPPNLAGILSCRRLLPWAKNVAVFDTAFYRTLPERAFVYALPWKFFDKYRIRKFGFHGISHAYVTQEAARRLHRPYGRLRLISCHLGSGASMTAVCRGRALETTMGFTPLEGLMMATRCGDIDPAIPLYMIQTLGFKPAEVDDIMNRQSGILGVSGFRDLRDTLTAAGYRIPGFKMTRRPTALERRRSRLAIDMFCHDIASKLGAFSAIMGGVDAVIFTAGVGERSAIIRDRVMSMVKLPGRPRVLVVPTNEELMIARETKRLA